ncbi:MAG: hypothetical protein IJ605_00105 [Prevotella sp.]|nr:hypothetical protein [Prevotella sp.]
MKKLSIFAVAITAMAFTACGGNKSAQTVEETKSFDQEQVEEKIKMEIDSLAANLGKLKQLPFVTKGEGGLQLTEEEKQVKPDYLFNPSVAENATTLAEMYRMASALTVDKNIAAMYDMPTDEYEKAITKLMADINDPSFKEVKDSTDFFAATEGLYEAMKANGRINYFWQLASASLVEEMYVMSQNSEKFLSVFDDESAANVTYRTTLLIDAIGRLVEYDPEIEPVATALKPLGELNAMTVDQLKTQLDEMKEEVASARAALVK